MPTSDPQHSAFIRQALRDLRMITNPDQHVAMLVRVMTNHHGLDDPELVALACAEVEWSRSSPLVRRGALAQLQSRAQNGFENGTKNETEPPATACVSSTISAKAHADPELARLANGLGLAAPFRLWLICRTHDANGVGQVARNSLAARLPSFGITHSRRYLNRLIRRGNGLLWAISADGTQLHLRSYEKVAQRLTALALAQNPALVLTNSPGQKFKTLSLAGSIADFEAESLAAWLDSRRDAGMTNIALDTLAALFGRSRNTIRDWVDRAGVQVQYNYTQYAGRDETLIPDHAGLYVTKSGDYAVTWQISSSYQPQPRPERQHKRTPRHVYHRCQHVIDQWQSGHPAGECGTARQSAEGAAAGGGVSRIGTLFFSGAESTHKARKRVYRHLRWHQDLTVAHHVLLGFKQGKGIYECVDPSETGLSSLHERDYKADHYARHRKHIDSHRDYLTVG